MYADQVQLHWIWREFSNKLESYRRRVQEGKDVAAASDFAKFVSWCGVIKLLEANPQKPPLVVDGAHLKWKCEELIRLCNDRFRTNDSQPHVEASELQSLHEKVDLMAAYLSRLSASPAVTVNPIPREVSDASPIGGTVFAELVPESRNHAVASEHRNGTLPADRTAQAA